jgi:isocitrate dehydrogenase kinase/phosphatase
VARAILAGFNKHYHLFREAARQAKRHFENADWAAMRELSRERIQMYDRRVQEAVESVLTAYPQAAHEESLWPAIKLAYIGLLHEHRQPECAETFYNSSPARCCTDATTATSSSSGARRSQPSTWRARRRPIAVTIPAARACARR